MLILFVEFFFQFKTIILANISIISYTSWAGRQQNFRSVQCSGLCGFNLILGCMQFLFLCIDFLNLVTGKMYAIANVSKVCGFPLNVRWTMPYHKQMKERKDWKEKLFVEQLKWSMVLVLYLSYRNILHSKSHLISILKTLNLVGKFSLRHPDSTSILIPFYNPCKNAQQWNFGSWTEGATTRRNPEPFLSVPWKMEGSGLFVDRNRGFRSFRDFG